MASYTLGHTPVGGTYRPKVPDCACVLQPVVIFCASLTALSNRFVFLTHDVAVCPAYVFYKKNFQLFYFFLYDECSYERDLLSTTDDLT